MIEIYLFQRWGLIFEQMMLAIISYHKLSRYIFMCSTLFFVLFHVPFVLIIRMRDLVHPCTCAFVDVSEVLQANKTTAAVQRRQLQRTRGVGIFCIFYIFYTF